MSEKIPVRFVKPWRSFFKDDVAGFPGDVAEELVGGGVAEYHAPGAASEAPVKVSRSPRGARSRGASENHPAGGSSQQPATGGEPTEPLTGAGPETPAPGAEGGVGGNGGDDDEEKP